MSDNKAKDTPVSELGQKLQKALNPEGVPKTVKKKGKRFEIPVSKTNFNRVKFQTHSLTDVLVREGYEANEVSVMFAGEPVSLDAIDLVIKPKLEKLTPAPRAS